MDNIREIVDIIIKIKNTNNIQELKKKSEKKYKNFMISNFQNFSFKYPKLFDMILINDDLKYLDLMLQGLEDIKKGKSKGEVDKEIGEQLAQQYVYPLVNKKKS